MKAERIFEIMIRFKFSKKKIEIDNRYKLPSFPANLPDLRQKDLSHLDFQRPYFQQLWILKSGHDAIAEAKALFDRQDPTQTYSN